MRTRLRALCAAAGMNDTDAATAVKVYLRRGGLTPAELKLLPQCTDAERSTYLSSLYGSDASRVAAAVLRAARP